MENLKQQISHFLEESINVQSALKPLKNGACLLIEVESCASLSLKKSLSSIRIEDSVSSDHQISFKLNVEAARHLLGQKDLPIPEFGVEVIKQIALGNIKIEIKASLIKLMRLGYLNILIEAGSPIWSQLSIYGIKNLSKLNQVISRIRN